MKVGDQRVDQAVAVAGQDEEPCPSHSGLDRLIAVQRGANLFQHTNACGPNRDNPASFGAGTVDQLRSRGTEVKVLGVHWMQSRVRDMDGAKCGWSDVERDECGLHSNGIQIREQAWCEV